MSEPSAHRPDIAYIPTPTDAVDAMLELAQVSAQDVLYDLGCGDGRLLIRAATRWGTRGVGIDIDPTCIQQTRRNAQVAGVAHLISLQQGNLYDSDVAAATVVALYLLPHLNARLCPRLVQQLRPGARIVSHQFDMGDWEPDEILLLPTSEEESVIYLWKIR
ncbi:cyclopropane-fatty-acyl-phospholipid synthase family protein [Halomicronema sp. CCY15110]|uniref:SAM-dependent methyltransferase n=1 Tax=Halomicronema sp. CCY15110 TaxID=2767773 RepID=UPI0019503D7A|nr:class I SAM-dependent methyltransferase [Halomicronema sp. CCY15110]